MTVEGELQVDEPTVERLLVAARHACGNAYVPYSAFPVGSAVLTESGEILTGANVENASFGLTVCGERVAVFGAVAEGHRVILAVAVSAPGSPGTSPCGACRQVLNEFRPRRADMTVILDEGDRSAPTIMRLSDLLPHAFGPPDLEASLRE
jgi:cytidine deaminase